MQKVNSFQDKDINKIPNLDSNNLAEGMSFRCIALVSNVQARIDKNNMHYVTFYVKDCNATTIRCMMFGINNIYDRIIEIQNYVNKPVDITVNVNNFNGQYSLILHDQYSIRALEESSFERERFVGKVDVNIDQLKQLSDFTEVNTESVLRYVNRSVQRIHGGKVNGYLKLYENVMLRCHNMASSSSLTIKWLVQTAQVTLAEYFEYLIDMEKSPIVAKERNLDRILIIKNTCKSFDSIPYMLDSVSAVLNLGNAETIYGYYVNKFIRETIEDTDVANTYGTMVRNTYGTLPGGEKILKY